MKITHTQLRRIIREELRYAERNSLNEGMAESAIEMIKPMITAAFKKSWKEIWSDGVEASDAYQ